jgi:hypothetical protein
LAADAFLIGASGVPIDRILREVSDKNRNTLQRKKLRLADSRRPLENPPPPAAIDVCRFATCAAD